MKIYADRFPTAARQLLTDLLAIGWIYLAVRAALRLQDLVQKLGVPGQKLEGAGGGLADNLAEASSKVGRLPIVGDDLTAPFEKAATAARSVAEAGQAQQDLVGDLALALALLTLATLLLPVLLGWLPLRVRWIRRASAASRLRAAEAGRDLLALRALTSQPLRKLARISPEVADAWRRGDPDTVAALAELELRGLGLRTGR